MRSVARHDAWHAADAYEAYMGRWSRQIAPHFLDWLAVSDGLEWLDVGCGTGALSAAILARCGPRSLIAIDPSEGFAAATRFKLSDERLEVQVGSAQSLPLARASRDIVVAGLVLNFVPDMKKALIEMKRVVRVGGTVGFYVWDYPDGGLKFLQVFWHAAAMLDAAASEFAEQRRFAFCTPDELVALSTAAGLKQVECTAIKVPTVFNNFADYWHPFTLGAGPAPGYLASLPTDHQQRLKDVIDRRLKRGQDGSITLSAKAWAIKAMVD